MKRIRLVYLILFLVSPFICKAQYRFSGNVENDSIYSTAYLSIIEDYRKISGVHEEQIISKVKINTHFFEFKGNNLDVKNKIYKIHIDSCNDAELDANHFNGKCDASREIIFIANNRDTVNLPISLENQMFCAIESNNKHSNIFFQIDSLKEQMRYDYGNYRSEANKKLNNRKWFAKLQQFGEQQNEPIAELYIYNFLSDRSGDLYAYYLKDVTTNTYYDELLDRLKSKYPHTSQTEQYEVEITSDRFISSPSNANVFSWKYVGYLLLFLSVVANILLLFKLRRTKKKRKEDLTYQLTQQEQKILDLILEDKTNKEIATEIFVSLSTVKTHINNLYKKLSIGSRGQLKSLFNR